MEGKVDGFSPLSLWAVMTWVLLAKTWAAQRRGKGWGVSASASVNPMVGLGGTQLNSSPGFRMLSPEF